MKKIIILLIVICTSFDSSPWCTKEAEATKTANKTTISKKELAKISAAIALCTFSTVAVLLMGHMKKLTCGQTQEALRKMRCPWYMLPSIIFASPVHLIGSLFITPKSSNYICYNIKVCPCIIPYTLSTLYAALLAYNSGRYVYRKINELKKRKIEHSMPHPSLIVR